MLRIKCPECGKNISLKATSCPGCGTPVAMKSGAFGGHEKGITVRPGFWHHRNVGAIAFFILFVIFLIVAGIISWING